jgi:hypothetical protein
MLRELERDDHEIDRSRRHPDLPFGMTGRDGLVVPEPAVVSASMP